MNTALIALAASALSLCAVAHADPNTAAPGAAGQDWWKDAVFYEVFVRSFADSSAGPLAGDGVGDLRGLIERLDELNDGAPGGDDLGVTALWLMPIAESPSYHGYDVVDYTSVDREYGTNEDFKELIAECEKRGMRVIVDLVLNHCSNAHPWFVEAASSKDSPRHDWFVWGDEKPDWQDNLHMWHDHAKAQTGQYYFGFFWHGMPDLNFDNPFVTATAYDISRTWLKDLGAHGFRLDAIRHLIERDGVVASTPETIQWLEAYHRYLRSIDPECFSVGEIWGDTSEVRQYIPNALDSAFEFQLASTIIGAVNSGDPSELAAHISRLNEAYADETDAAPYSTFLTNHDQNRLMSELGGVSAEGFAKNKLAASILLTLPGTPFLYYGEEIGMTGTKPDPDLRVPMQWTDDPRTAGFTTGEPWRALNDDLSPVNVAFQKTTPDSLRSHYKAMIELRTAEPALRRGTAEIVDMGSDALLGVRRRLGDDEILVIANLSDTSVRTMSVDLDGFDPGAMVQADLLAGRGRARPGRADDDGRTAGWKPVNRIGPREVSVLKIVR